MKYEAEHQLFSSFCETDTPAVSEPLRHQPARVALVGGFRPRQCGIATFPAET